MTTEATHHRRITWLELFYDLVFVVVIEQLTHLVVDEPSGHRLAAVGGLAVIVWVAWFNVTAFTNLTGEIDGIWRIPVFVSMAGVGVMALGLEDLAHDSVWLFVIGYAIARTAMLPLWLRRRRERGVTWFRTAFHGPGLGALWVLTGFLPRPWTFWAWGALIALELGLSFTRSSPGDEGLHYDGPHMIERVGLFLMIVLGESVVQIVHALEEHREVANWVAAGLGMALLCALWWLVHGATVERLEEAVEKSPGSVLDFIGGAQLGIVAGLIGVAGGLAGTIEHAHVESGAPHVPAGFLTALVVGLVLVVLGVRSLSSKVWAIKIKGLESGPVGAVAQAAFVVLPFALVHRVGGHWSPAVLLVVLLLVVGWFLAFQVMSERRIEQFLALGGDLVELRQRGRRGERGERPARRRGRG